jgi:OOP family OmpA-OmpF porin
MKKFRVAILSACALASATCAQGQEPPRRWYAGVAGGATRTSHDLVANREATIVNLDSVQSDLDLNDTGWKAFAGWRIAPVLSLEAYYADLGKHRVLSHVMGGGPPPTPSTFDLTHKISGFGADAVVFAPVMSREFSVFGRVGAFASRLEAEATLGGNIVFSNGDPSDTHRAITRNETVLHYGVGGQWDFRPDMAVRVEWERFTKIGKPFAVGGSGTTGEADTDLASIGLVYRF